MKLQNFPVLTALLLLSLSVPVFAHGGRGGGPRGGGFRGAAVGPRGGFVIAGGRGVIAGGRFHGNRFVHPGRFNQFNRFDRFNRFHQFNRFNRFNSGVNSVVVYGGGYPYYYPGYGDSYSGNDYDPYNYLNNPGYVTYPNSTTRQYPRSYYYSNYYVDNPAPAPVGEYAPIPVTSDVVSRVQQMLKARGFYAGPIDGVSGGATRAAIRAYDAAVGLPVTGSIDAPLLAALGL